MENAINAGKRVDGAVTPHVFMSEKWLSNFNRVAEGGEEGGGAASITIAEGLITSIELTLGWNTDVKVTNEEPMAIVLPQLEVAGGVPVRYLQVGNAS